MSTVVEYLEDRARVTDAALEFYLSTWEGAPESLREAIRYSLFAGGKRLRPALALCAAEIVCGHYSVAMPAACAIEMIHTYSLIHDDLPCMDDDDMRRGKPTLHRAYDEATAVLAGDGLQAMAFDTIADAGNIAVVKEIALAAGVAGMVGGQYVDLQSEGKELPLEDVQAMHRMKTGALIRVSVRAGAMLAGANREQLENLTQYGEHLGLAFQIADDILDVVGDDAEMGKQSGMDEARRKLTYPGLVGLEEAKGLGRESVEMAVLALEAFGLEADPLRDIARFVMERNR